MATFGKIDTGTANGGSPGWGITTKYELTEAGNVTNISFYSLITDGNTVTVAIYDDDGAGGIPSTRLWISAAVDHVAAWMDFAVPSLALAAGFYWLAFIEGSASWRYSAAGTYNLSAGLGNPWVSAGGGAGIEVCIHADYTPSGGGAVREKIIGSGVYVRCQAAKIGKFKPKGLRFPKFAPRILK